MTDRDVNSYYALVWNSILTGRKEVTVQGKVVHRHSMLPRDPEILYGTNPNDVARIKVVEQFEEVKYNAYTMKQSVRFWKEIDEYVIPRDVRIIVWEGNDKLELPTGKYRVVSPELFDLIRGTSGNLKHHNSYKNSESEWLKYKDPMSNIQDRILNDLGFLDRGIDDDNSFDYKSVKASSNQNFCVIKKISSIEDVWKSNL